MPGARSELDGIAAVYACEWSALRGMERRGHGRTATGRGACFNLAAAARTAADPSRTPYSIPVRIGHREGPSEWPVEWLDEDRDPVRARLLVERLGVARPPPQLDARGLGRRLGQVRTPRPTTARTSASPRTRRSPDRSRRCRASRRDSARRRRRIVCTSWTAIEMNPGLGVTTVVGIPDLHFLTCTAAQGRRAELPRDARHRRAVEILSRCAELLVERGFERALGPAPVRIPTHSIGGVCPSAPRSRSGPHADRPENRMGEEDRVPVVRALDAVAPLAGPHGGGRAAPVDRAGRGRRGAGRRRRLLPRASLRPASSRRRSRSSRPSARARSGSRLGRPSSTCATRTRCTWSRTRGRPTSSPAVGSNWVSAAGHRSRSSTARSRSTPETPSMTCSGDPRLIPSRRRPPAIRSAAPASSTMYNGFS